MCPREEHITHSSCGRGDMCFESDGTRQMFGRANFAAKHWFIRGTGTTCTTEKMVVGEMSSTGKEELVMTGGRRTALIEDVG